MIEFGGSCYFQKRYNRFGLRFIVVNLGLCLFIGPSGIYGDNVCGKDECYKTARGLMSSMDPNVDPCDNFYKYACGGFVNKTILPENRDAVDFVTDLGYDMRKELRIPIEMENQLNDPKIFRLMRTLYKSCMNEVSINDKGLEPLHQVLKKLGGWPVIEGQSWIEASFDWVNVSYSLAEAGYQNYLINIEVRQYLKNNARNLIHISPPEFKTNSTAYLEYMVAIARFLGFDKNHTDELRDTMNFENELLHASELRGNGYAGYFNLMTIDKLSEKFPTIPWKDILSRLSPAFIHLDDHEIVNVEFPDYFSYLENLIARTPKRIFADYLVWRVIQDSIKFLNSDIREIEYKHALILRELSRRSPRWDECLNVLHKQMTLGTVSMYARNFGSEKIEGNIVRMVNHLREQLILTFETFDKMDPKMKERAIEKIKSEELHVGRFDVFFDDKKLDKFYESLEVTKFDYYNSIINATKFNINANWKQLRETPRRIDWRLMQKFFHEPGPFNMNLGNGMIIPAASLTNFVFNENRPNYVNYGRMGFIISHELTHGFDTIGLKFDKYGNFFNLFTSETIDNFIQRVQCIIQQYGNYTVTETGQIVDGYQTVNENIADNSGVQLAYRAYNDWIANNAPEGELPVIGKTPKQLFWLSYASFWCGKSTKDYLSNYINTVPHSPLEYRVIGPLSNSPQFANDWKCPLGSNMNPVHKCSIW